MDEKELIKASRQGDNNAFKQIIQKYEPQVAATVIGMIGNSQEAEDIGQETFIRFYRNLPNFRGESSIGTYITRIAINLTLNEIKKRNRRSKLIFTKDDDEINNIPDEERTLADSVDAHIVRWAIQRLKPHYRTVLVLRLIEGCSTEETANILQLPVGTVLSRLRRAKKRMMELLLPYMEEI